MAQMIYNVEDKPKWSTSIMGGFQHLLSIIAATILVPILIGVPEGISAALFGCGVGTLVYLLITKRKSPVIISSNFAFIAALTMAYANYGYLGIMLGGIFTGVTYVVISIIVKFTGTKWISKVFPPIVIGPVVALIGLTLAYTSATDIVTANGYQTQGGVNYNLVALFIGLTTFFVIVILSVQNRLKKFRMIPFLFGIGAGYLLSLFFTGIGYLSGVDYLKIIDFTPIADNFTNLSFRSFIDYPKMALIGGINEIAHSVQGVAEGGVKLTGIGVLEIFLAFVPITLVSFSEHIADHKNLGNIIGRDLLEGEPGLSRTLMGDGVGSIVGTIFGICPNTTYGETVGCIAVTKDASIRTISVAAILTILLSFFSPLIAFLRTIPNCVAGGMCFVLYGFIAASGFKMMQKVDLDRAKNLFTLAVILVSGIGGLVLQIPYQFEVVPETETVISTRFITLSPIAFALVLGLITYAICDHIEKHNSPEES